MALHTCAVDGDPCAGEQWPRDGSAPVRVAGALGGKRRHANGLRPPPTVDLPHAAHRRRIQRQRRGRARAFRGLRSGPGVSSPDVSRVPLRRWPPGREVTTRPKATTWVRPHGSHSGVRRPLLTVVRRRRPEPSVLRCGRAVGLSSSLCRNARSERAGLAGVWADTSYRRWRVAASGMATCAVSRATMVAAHLPVFRRRGERTFNRAEPGQEPRTHAKRSFNPAESFQQPLTHALRSLSRPERA
jgi:hypothetical protein